MTTQHLHSYNFTVRQHPCELDLLLFMQLLLASLQLTQAQGLGYTRGMY